MTRILITICALSLLVSASARAQDEAVVADPSDTAAVAAPSLNSDSLYTPPDTAAWAADTTSVADSVAIGDFAERYEEYRQEHLARTPQLSFGDSAVAYLCSPRLSVREDLDRSFYHDAGDFCRFDPSFFVVDRQVTPMRKTVQPFGLSGGRLNLIVNRRLITPFEHVIEPDGQADMNDLPAELNGEIYLLPGPAGMLLGGSQAVATMVSLPRTPGSSVPETAILGEKGWQGWSWMRGRYSRRFNGGKEIDASVGYREADGISGGRSDNAYHYSANALFPVGQNYGVRASGYMYSRDGWLTVRPDISGGGVSRERFDRQWSLSLNRLSSDGRARLEAGYARVEQGSRLGGQYVQRFDNYSHGGFIVAERMLGVNVVRAELQADDLEFSYWPDEKRRTGVDLGVSLLRGGEEWSYALKGGGHYEKDYDFSPQLAAVLSRRTLRTLLLLSAGYSERVPSLYERYLPYRQANVYPSQQPTYADQGNPSLKRERQLVASASAEYGTSRRALRLTITGGHIVDGIDWKNQPLPDSVGGRVLFSPVNTDISFVNVAIQARWALRDLMTLSAGASLREVDYAEYETVPYCPEYQTFAGLELHHYWRSTGADLFAYGEIVYTGPYDGYLAQGLGEAAVANAKVTLGLPDFRFFMVWQNLFGIQYSLREYSAIQGLFFQYGIVWSFLD